MPRAKQGKIVHGKLDLDCFGIPLEMVRKSREMNRRLCGLRSRYYEIDLSRFLGRGRQLFHKF